MITTTKDDIILLGHGTYLGGADTFKLPEGVELHITQPVGSALRIDAAGVLLANRAVDRAVLVQPSFKYDDFAALGLGNGTVYKPGERAPNLLLHDLGAQKARLQALAGQGHSQVVYVSKDTLLASILGSDATVKQRIADAVKANTVVKIYWAACTALTQNPDSPPVVCFNAMAIAAAAAGYASQHPALASATRAAEAVMEFALANPLDTQGALNVVNPLDATVGTLLKSL